ncbi:MAG: hypothetical protein ACO2ZZ_01795 [Cyclobacteriaceae bacterium]
MKSFFGSLVLIINYKTFIVTILSIVATWICIQLNFLADFNLSMISVAMVFPIVFAINSAFQRREEALKALAGIKGLLVAIFLAIKHWGEDESRAERSYLQQVEGKINLIIVAVGKYLVRLDHDMAEFGVYNTISHLSEQLQEMRKIAPGSDMARLNEYVSMILVHFEELKIIREYRTPITLRTYSKFFIYSFPLLFAPFFAASINVFSFVFITYFVPAMYSFILISLINIQEHMEDPFDGIGEDDIKIEAERFDSLLFELDANHPTNVGTEE